MALLAEDKVHAKKAPAVRSLPGLIFYLVVQPPTAAALALGLEISVDSAAAAAANDGRTSQQLILHNRAVATGSLMVTWRTCVRRVMMLMSNATISEV
jgi:uncharacterized membrane protein